MAEAEKAVVDFFYLNLSRFDGKSKDIFSLSYRFQDVSSLNKEKLDYFGRIFKSKKLMKVINCFSEFIESEGQGYVRYY